MLLLMRIQRILKILKTAKMPEQRVLERSFKA